MANQKKSFWRRLQQKYTVSVRNEDSFMENAKATLSLLEILSIGLVCIFSIGLGSFLLFKYTPLNLLFGENNAQRKAAILTLFERTDSLERELNQKEVYYETIHKILRGDSLTNFDSNLLDSQELKELTLADPTKEEIAMRNKVAAKEQTTINPNLPIELVSFELPLVGAISSSFNEKTKHYGIDIVAPKNTPIKSIADGQVLYSSWNVNDGYSLIIVHDNGFQSIYKHAEKLLKDVNEPIQSGEAIAVIGNSGENTSGYHLHFELWKEGQPVNPADYINFK